MKNKSQISFQLTVTETKTEIINFSTKDLSEIESFHEEQNNK